MIRPVLKRGSSILLQKSKEIINFSAAKNLVYDLWDTLHAIQKLYDFKRGSGVSANQIGELWRVSVLEFDTKKYTLINPKIINHSNRKLPVTEGCLCFFDYRGKVMRYDDVTVQATDLNGTPYVISSGGDLNFASLLQHEIDHLDGILYDSLLEEDELLHKISGLPSIP